ncbi:MAG: T9SS type A sorting domain-containing protein, partial [Sphingomonadales bacterium]
TWVANDDSYNPAGSVSIDADANGKVAITLEPNEDQNVAGAVIVSDANGKLVYNGSLTGLSTEFNLRVPAGVYYITVQSGNLIEKKKVFIQE